jgi:hypothetical protein
MHIMVVDALRTPRIYMDCATAVDRAGSRIFGELRIGLCNKICLYLVLKPTGLCPPEHIYFLTTSRGLQLSRNEKMPTMGIVTSIDNYVKEYV